MRPLVCVVTLVMLSPPALVSAAVDPAVIEAENERIAVMDRAKDAVLAIFASNGQGGGSGVVISPDGFALTNFHVAKPCGNAMKCGMADGRLYDAVIVGVDPTGDVALIKLLGRDDFPHAEMVDSDLARAGDWVFAMGNPFLLATDFQPTVTYGILSGVHRYQFPAGTLLEYTDCLQTDASINPGNSGGPLFDAAGRLIGINGRASFEKRGRVNVGIAYAISINQIKNFLGYLHSGRIVDHATLGARVAFDSDGRVVVIDILEESDAYRRGLRYDDEIVSFGGRPIFTPNGFKNVLGIYPKGWRVPLSFRRAGRRHDILVRLAGVHTQSELLEKTEGSSHAPPMPIPESPERPKSEDGREREKGENDGRERRLPPVPNQRPGQPHQIDQKQAQKPMPEAVEKLFEQRRGYANYHFNLLNRDRVWQAWAKLGDLASPAGWTISGPLDGGRRFTLQVTGTGASLGLPGGIEEWTAGREVGKPLVPRGSGGLLQALYLWRRLATEGIGNFGEVYYLGTVPLVGSKEPADVLVGIHDTVECRFFFAPGDGRLLALEMYPEENVDPAEVYFSEYREVQGRLLPGRLEARFGDELFGVFSIDSFDLNDE